MKYRPFGPVIFRMSALSPEQIKTRQNFSIEQLIHDPLFSNAMSKSKSRLWKGVEHFGKNKYDNNISSTLKKYLVRMGTRHSPMGLFAGAGVGEISPSNDFPILREKLVSKEVYLEKNKNLPKDFVLNPSCYWQNNHLHIYFYDAQAQKYLLNQLEIPTLVRRAILSYSSRQISSEKFPLHLKKELKISFSEAKSLLRDLIFLQVLVPLVEGPTWSSTAIWKNSEEAGLIWQGTKRKIPQLSEKIATKLLSATETMHKIWHSHFSYSNQSALLLAVRHFIERFYDHGPVPLLSITEMGLTPLLSKSRFTSLPAALENLLHEKIRRAQSDRNFIWNVDAAEVDRMATAMNPYNNWKPPKSISVLAQVQAGGEILSYSFLTANSASKLFARMGIFDDKIQKVVSEVQDWEKRNLPTANLCSISYGYPKTAKSLLSENISDLTAVIDCQGVKANGITYPLSEMGLSIFGMQIKIVHLPTGKILTPCGTHLVTYENETHLPYRILRDIERQETGEPARWSWGSLEASYSFFPRVVVKGVIVSSARWILRPKDLLENLNLPTTVLLIERDMKLPLETDSLIFQREVSRRQNKGLAVIFEEVLFSEDSFEVCIPAFEANDQPVGKNKKEITVRNINKFVHNLRLSFDPFRMDELLKEVKKEFLRLKISYIFYDDFSLHLRLRIFCSNKQEFKKVSARLAEWQMQQMENGNLLSVSCQTHGPESLRWFGDEGTRLYENLSCHDSAFQLEQSAPGTPSIDGVAKYLLFWSQWFSSKEFSTEQILKSAYQRIGKMKPIQPITLKTPVEKGQPGYSQTENLQKRLKAIRPEIQKFLKPLSVDEKVHWIGGFLHFVMNRQGFVGDHAMERLCLQRALKIWSQKIN